MKFKSRKDRFFYGLIIGIIGMYLAFVIFRLLQDGYEDFTFRIFDFILLLPLLPLIWIWIHTGYELTNTEFKYHSGPLRGTIELHRIKEVIQGKTMWVSLKPATAGKGLIIKFDKYEEIYISPDSNELFIEKLLGLRPDIKILG